jgi:hypothetical protein
MRVLYNGATLHLVPSNRKPTFLCSGQLREIERYIGLHCFPTRIGSNTTQRWLYCFLVHNRNNRGNRYLKIVLEQQRDVLVIIAKYLPQDITHITQILLDICVCKQSTDDLRTAFMSSSNTFMYDSVKRFADAICDTPYRIEWTDEATFTSLWG